MVLKHPANSKNNSKKIVVDSGRTHDVDVSTIKRPELLAPAGSFASLRAAVQAGADAIYFGVKGLNMRSGAGVDFSLDDVKEIVSYCHENNIKAYLALNTIIYDNEDEKVSNILVTAKNCGVDAVIAWDLLVIKKALDLGLEVHLSTMASVSNFEAVKFFAELGVKRIVLARELDLVQIRNIIKKISLHGLDVEIEVFIHGAMCISISGRCYMSQIAHCKSANRGECLQPCRRSYHVVDDEGEVEFVLENGFVMSPKDLCVMPILDHILEAGVSVLKIEGRARPPEYVKVVVESYKKAIDAFFNGSLTDSLKNDLIKRMERVYNKGFETGFYLGRPLYAWAGVYGSRATTKKVYIGRVVNYYKKIDVLELQVHDNSLSNGDSYYIIGDSTGVIESMVDGMLLDDEPVDSAGKGSVVTFKAPFCRIGDKVYKIVPSEFSSEASET